MKISGFSKLAAICLLIVAAALATPSIAMQGDTVADRVLGQPNFFTRPSSVTNRGLNGPFGVAIDKSVVPNRLYVSDSMNNRILGYKDVTTFTNGGPADLVLGQSSFSSNTCTNGGGVNASSLCQPHGLAVDASGNLYVADTNRNRVLEYNTPFSGCGPCIGAPANRVFGQNGLFGAASCNNGGISANSLCGPQGVALDSNGNLFVADTSNNRVLEYDAPLTTNTTADTVFGQLGSFTSNTANNGGTSANSLRAPVGVGVDAGNNLYVADTNNMRVLEYNTPLTTDTTADTVLGQLGFTSNSCVGLPTNRTLCDPDGVAVDATGNVYVAGSIVDNRVLQYHPPLSNGAMAVRVFGQLGSFSTRTRNDGGLSADSLYQPTNVAVDSSGNLYVADFNNNRVMEYKTPLTTDTTADVVLGQGDFLNNSPNAQAATAASLQSPSSVAIDTSVFPNRLYVADGQSNRVLGWKDVTAISFDSPADLVIGQPDFTSDTCNNGNSSASASSLCGASEVVVDASGNLYVGDNLNHRVLEYNIPFAGCGSFPCVGGSANLVFGQGGSFTSNIANNGGVNANSVEVPSALAVDADGNLYVSDTNNRVLEYNTPLTTDTTADLVFGQSGSFTSNGCNQGGLSANSLCGPNGLAVDATGDIFISDTSNCRVLEFDSPLTTDTVADEVFGQPDFVSSTCNNGGITANSLYYPFGIGLDPYGDLYVSDNNNNRVLEYNNPSTNNTANVVFGQLGSFTTATSNNGGVSASSLSGPLDVKADSSGNIYVADAINGRVLEYDNPLGLTITPTPTATPTPTSTSTATPTMSATDTVTPTPTDTATATATATDTATATATDTATATPTATDTATSTATPTDTATSTATATDTATPTATATATPTATPTTSMTVTASLAFGNVAVGQTLTKTVTVYNTGATHPLLVSSATPSDPEYALSGTGTCGAIPVTVAPKTNCTMGVSFTPDALGAHSASLMLFDNATSSPQHVTLTGIGIADLTLSKTSLVYGSVKFGAKATQSFGVTNHQSRSVSLDESFSGTNASDFSITGGTCTTMLAAKTACSIIVTFEPGALGTESASLSVSDSPDPLSPYTVSLSTGPTIPATVTPTTLAYGTLTSSSKTKTVTVTNKSGFPLSLSESIIPGTDSTDFTITGGTCTATALPNSTCTITVKFTPTAGPTQESATMAVTIGNDPTSPHNVSLTGTGP